MNVGLGIVTYHRPQYFRQCAAAIRENLATVVDKVYVAKDVAPVAKAKNRLLRRMIDDGHDWLFIGEDDVLPRSYKAITGYIRACEESGFQHLSFHGHGTANINNSVGTYGRTIKLWPHFVGAWCVYSRDCLEAVGLMDENFQNAYEHVHHSLQLANAGFTYPWPGVADAVDSEKWLKEITGSLSNSSIRRDPEWHDKIEKSTEYWQQAHPETYAQIFGQRWF